MTFSLPWRREWTTENLTIWKFLGANFSRRPDHSVAQEDPNWAIIITSIFDHSPTSLALTLTEINI